MDGRVHPRGVRPAREESDWHPLYREMYPDDFEEDYWRHMAVDDEPD